MKEFSFVAVLFVSLFLAGCADLLTKDNVPPPTPLSSLSSSMKVTTLWNKVVGDGVGENVVKFKLASDQKYLYTADYLGLVSVVDINTGELQWQKQLTEELLSGPAIGKKIIVVSTTNGEAIALNKKTGKQYWKIKLPTAVLAAATITDDVVLFRTLDGNLVAYDVDSGRLDWTYHHGSPALVLRGGGEIPVSEGLAAVGFADGKLDVVNIETGKLLWQRSLAIPIGGSVIERMVDIGATPIIDHGNIYTASYQGRVAAFQLKTGKLIWQHDLSSHVGLALSKSVLIVIDSSSQVWAFDKQSGAVLWKQSQLQYRQLSEPAIVDNYIATGDGEGYIHWLSLADGHIVARKYLDAEGINARPVVFHHNLYVLTKSGSINALHLS